MTPFSSIRHDQMIIKVAQGAILSKVIESFLIDRNASGLAPRTIKFYREYLKRFLTYCDANEVKLVQDVSADIVRRYLFMFGETHNPGGTHAAYRCLRALFRWLADGLLSAHPSISWFSPMTAIGNGRAFKATSRYFQRWAH